MVASHFALDLLQNPLIMLAGELVQAQAEMSMAPQGAVEAALIHCSGDLEADRNGVEYC